MKLPSKGKIVSVKAVRMKKIWAEREFAFQSDAIKVSLQSSGTATTVTVTRNGKVIEKSALPPLTGRAHANSLCNWLVAWTIGILERRSSKGELTDDDLQDRKPAAYDASTTSPTIPPSNDRG